METAYGVVKCDVYSLGAGINTDIIYYKLTDYSLPLHHNTRGAAWVAS